MSVVEAAGTPIPAQKPQTNGSGGCATLEPYLDDLFSGGLCPNARIWL